MKTKLTKTQLIEHCRFLLTERINTASNAMKNAQESSNSEDKSSAGDKYETSRSMGHIDRDMNARQMVKAKEELAILEKIDFSASDHVKTGALVHTSKNLYFIAVGLGTVLLEQEKIIVVSPISPLAKFMIGKKIGDNFVFNGNKDKIEHID